MTAEPAAESPQNLENALQAMNAMILADIARGMASSSRGGPKNYYVFQRNDSRICMVLRDTLEVEGAKRVHGPGTFAECIAFVNTRSLEGKRLAADLDEDRERASDRK